LRQEGKSKDEGCYCSISKSTSWFLLDAFVDVVDNVISEAVMEIESAPYSNLPTVYDLVNCMDSLVNSSEPHQQKEGYRASKGEEETSGLGRFAHKVHKGK